MYNTGSETNRIEKQSKSEVLLELIKFFKFIEPQKTIPLERDIKLKQILEDTK
jgi:hypothetical protein